MNDTELSKDLKAGILEIIYNGVPEANFLFTDPSISLEDLLRNMGIAELTLQDFLEILEYGAAYIEQAYNEKLFQNGSDGMTAYHSIGVRCAPIACHIYNKLLEKGEEPRLPTYLAVNRCRSSDSTPDTVLFWVDPDAIRGLYEVLLKDGYFKKKEATNASA